MEYSVHALDGARRSCYGAATAVLVGDYIAVHGELGSYAVPYLRSLLVLLEADGHWVDDIREELDRVASIVYACRDDLSRECRIAARETVER